MSKEFFDKLKTGDVDGAINTIKESLELGFNRTIDEKKQEIVEKAGFMKKEGDMKDDESDDEDESDDKDDPKKED